MGYWLHRYEGVFVPRNGATEKSQRISVGTATKEGTENMSPRNAPRCTGGVLEYGKLFKKKELVAERKGFEPLCRVSPTIRFRVGAVMTTSVPLPLCRGIVPDFRCWDKVGAWPKFL